METFAENLRHWRGLRRFSQLDLAMEAQVSSRHISFLESGRARPSREMIDRLSETLNLPLSASNRMMLSAGFAPRYDERSWDDAQMAPVRAAIDQMLENHDPYPGFAVDGMWNILKLNRTAETLFRNIGLAEGKSVLEVVTGDLLPELIENWPEVAHHTAQRLRTESMAMGGVEVFDKVAKKLGEVERPSGLGDTAVISTVYHMGEVRLSLFSTIAQFGTPLDVALDNLKVELFFPSDQTTADILNSMA